MKKNLFSLGVMLVAAFTLTNCAKEVQSLQDVENTPYTIYANTSETKTANDGLSTVWVEGDALNVFATAAGSTVYGTSSKFTLKDASSGEFETGDLKADLTATNDWYALYPYSQYVTTPAGKDAGYIYIGNKNGLSQEEYNSTSHLAGSACPLCGVAKAVSGDVLPSLEMNHLTSVVQINVTNGTSSTFAIKELSFTSSDCDIVGHYFVDFTQKVPVLTPREGNVSNSALLTVTNPSDLAPSKTASFYIVVRPFTAPENSTLTIKIGSVEKTKTLAESVVFAAGKIKGINYTLTEQPVAVPPTKATVKEFLGAVEGDTWYELTGTVSNIANTTYGNFDLTDATGKVYVYGLTKTKVASNDKSFASIGLKEGDVVTLIGKRASYKDTPQVGGPAYYVSHVAGEEPEPEPSELTHPLTSNLIWNVVSNSYKETATINSTAGVNVFKLGKSEEQGTATITLPAGTAKVGFYALSWSNKPAKLVAKYNGQIIASLEPTANVGAAGSAPYTITASDANYYELVVKDLIGVSALDKDYQYTLTTEGTNYRVLIWGLNYYTANGIGAAQQPSEDPDQTTDPSVDSYTLMFGSDYNSGGISAYDESWTVTCNGFTCEMANWNNNNNGWNYVKAGSKRFASVATITTQNLIAKAISSVVMTVDAVTATEINSLKLYVASDKDFKNAKVYEATAAKGDVTFEITSPISNAYYKIEVDCQKGSNNGLITVSKVIFQD